MSSRTYGQFCGLARALDMIGERWAMLVVRDLLLGPKRFTELRRGLPRMPESILSSRLNELERAGVVQRRVLTGFDASVVYELTEYGSELRAILLRLALWGARTLGRPEAGELFTVDAAILSLHTTFRADLAAGVHVVYEMRFGPEVVLRVAVADGTLEVTEADAPDADLVIRPRGPMKPMLSGEVSVPDALDRGMVEIHGDAALLGLFTQLFHIPAAPRPAEGLRAQAPTADPATPHVPELVVH